MARCVTFGRAWSSVATLGERHTVFSQLYQVSEGLAAHWELPCPRGGGSWRGRGCLGGGGHDGRSGFCDGSSFTHRLERRIRVIAGGGGGYISLEVEGEREKQVGIYRDSTHS